MNRKIAACLMIGLTAAGCGRKDRNPDSGLGAGADSAALRDPVAAPAPAVVPTDSVTDSLRQHSSADQPTRNQTQSGMKNRAGQSTLGAGVTRTRPDANEPVMAKGDTLARSADQRATDSLNRAALDRINGEHDTMPQPSQPTPVPPVPTDSTRPAPADSIRPVLTDSTKSDPTDSTRTPPPLPLDTIVKPMRDSTTRDTTRQQ